MDFLEKDLEQIIYEATDEQLAPFDFPMGIRKRQLNIGGYGVADLVFFEKVSVGPVKYNEDGNPYQDVIDSGLCITVCEFKKDIVDASTFLQAIRYCKGISKYLEKRNFYSYYFNILLIGRKLNTSSDFIFLPDIINQNNRFTYMGTDMEEHYIQGAYFNQGLNKVDIKTYSYSFNGIQFQDHADYKPTNEGF